MPVNQNELDAYLKLDRQWLRPNRIAAARYQLSKATSKDDQDFWLEVLHANGFYDLADIVVAGILDS
jgi:hypothetical protein